MPTKFTIDDLLQKLPQIEDDLLQKLPQIELESVIGGYDTYAHTCTTYSSGGGDDCGGSAE